MAGYQDLTASNSKNKSADTSATKATMQADMDAALQNKQRSNNYSDEVSQAKSDELIAKTVNDAGERVLDETQISRVIEMAWEDRTPFGAIEHSYGLDAVSYTHLTLPTNREV